MRKTIFVSLLLAFAFGAKANHWIPDPYQFADNMNVIGVIEINGVEQTSDRIEIGAFCNGECRGSEMLAYYEGLNRYMVFLTLYGQSGHTLDFRLYDHDAQAELDITPSATIQFVANGIVGSLVEPYVFAFSGGSCVVTAEAQPTEGGTVSGSGTFLMGETCTLTASPSEQFRFLYWTESGETVSTSASYTFTVVSDRLLTAHFERISYQVEGRPFPENAGSVEGSGSYFQGESCTLTASSNFGYSFAEWKDGDAMVCTDSIYTFDVEYDRSLIAVFLPNEYQISFDIEPAEGGEVVGNGFYVYGDTAWLHATPNPTYYFIDWKENGETVCTLPDFPVVVDGNHHFVATFAQDCYVVTAISEPFDGGTISGAGNYISGTVCHLTTHPASGFGFEKWTENGATVSTSASYSFTVEANHDLTAHFFRVPYEITVSANPEIGGTVEGGGWFYYGDVCTLNATPFAGYGFSHWEASGQVVSFDSEYSFVVTRDADLTAHFVDVSAVEDAESVVSVFPNPSHGNVSIVCPSMKRIEVYDILGCKVYGKECQSDSVEISIEKQGVYFVIMSDGLIQTAVKVIIE